LLRRRRLNEACRLLTETNATMTAIAQRCGFGSANYFAQVFRREVGQTPSDYRQASSKGK
jgi:AraC-like DNA-binding protein